MMLEILIPSIPERMVLLNNLINELNKQIRDVSAVHPALGGVIISVDDSKSYLEGGLSVGDKRDLLVQRAKAKYLCFLDDDDKVAPNYVEELLRLCYYGNDICTFKSLFTCDTYWTVINMQLGVDNEQATPYREVQRNAWHICPVKSMIAQNHRFQSKNNAEDWDWFSRVLSDVQTEAHTNQILHNYNHSALTSEVDKIEKL